MPICCFSTPEATPGCSGAGGIFMPSLLLHPFDVGVGVVAKAGLDQQIVPIVLEQLQRLVEAVHIAIAQLEDGALHPLAQLGPIHLAVKCVLAAGLIEQAGHFRLVIFCKQGFHLLHDQRAQGHHVLGGLAGFNRHANPHSKQIPTSSCHPHR
jgi:hypothetical protein